MGAQARPGGPLASTFHVDERDPPLLGVDRLAPLERSDDLVERPTGAAEDQPAVADDERGPSASAGAT